FVLFSLLYDRLIDYVEVGTMITLDDGLIALEVTEIDHENKEVITKVINSGMSKNRKGVNIPNVHLNLPSMTTKDEEDIVFGVKESGEFIAASFVRSPNDVFKIHKLLDDNVGQTLQIISKIENREGVDHVDEILAATYALMIARGNLGVETPAVEVPLVQNDLIHR